MDEVLKLWTELVGKWVPKDAHIGDYVKQEEPIRDDQLVALLSGLPERTIFNDKAMPPGTVYYSGFISAPRTIRGQVPIYDLRRDLSLDDACALADRYILENSATF